MWVEDSLETDSEKLTFFAVCFLTVLRPTSAWSLRREEARYDKSQGEVSVPLVRFKRTAGNKNYKTKHFDDQH